MIITNSEAHTYLRCQRKWGFSSHNRQNLTPIAAPASALNVGSLVHHGLEHALNKHPDPWMEVARKGKADIEAIQANSVESLGVGLFDDEIERLNADLDLAIQVVQNYCAYWRFTGQNRSTVEPYEVMATEVTFQVPVPGTSHHYAGTFDAILRDPLDRIWIMDHKTYSRPAPRDKQEMLWQFRSYGWVASQLFPQNDIGGTIYNGLKKQIPAKPAPLKSGRLSKAKATIASTTAIQYLSAIQENQLDPGDYVEEITFLINRDKNDNPFFERWEMPRNTHTERSWLEAFTNLVKQMENAGPLVPNFDWRGCTDCGFRRLCHAFERAEALPVDRYQQNTHYQTAQALELTPDVVTSVEDLLS